MVRNDGNKPFAGTRVFDLHPIYTFEGELPDDDMKAFCDLQDAFSLV